MNDKELIGSIFANVEVEEMKQKEGGTVRSQPKLKTIHYSKLKTPTNNRDIDYEKVDQLVDSILDIGLQQFPVVSAAADEDGFYYVLGGNHRKEAIRKLVEEEHREEYEYVRCIVSDKDEIDNELIQIDTNLLVNELSSFDLMMAIGRKEELLKQKKEKGVLRSVIAEEMNLKDTQVGTYLKVYKRANETVKLKLRRNEITLTQAAKLASIDPKYQNEKLKEMSEPKDFTIERDNLSAYEKWVKLFSNCVSNGRYFYKVLNDEEYEKLLDIVFSVRKRYADGDL